MEFPSNLKRGVTFHIIEHSNVNKGRPSGGSGQSISGGGATKVGGAIKLPIPQNLKSVYETEWNAEDLGIAGLAAQQLGAENVNEAAFAERVANLTAKSGAKVLADQLGANGLVGAYEYANSQIIDPVSALLFKGVKHRPLDMSWRLTPKNEADCATITSIIRTFKAAMAPKVSGDGSLWKYPKVFDIAFTGIGNMPFRYDHCALLSCEADMTPDSIYAALRNGYPVSVGLSLSFLELKVMTAENIEQGY